ncbi:macrophage mannose receptor 1-like [Trachinotus anak]|uniref:macrophage mannose receptor 1-like n=1 Tax=Trachinotus anak TaxID=443729 RepID=UPI0039F1B8AB
MSVLVIFLLTSGCVPLCAHVHREYHLINEKKTWFEAQSYCRKNYGDLATIGSHGDMKRLEYMTAASGATAGIWIGLSGSLSFRKDFWQWSAGETWMSHGVAEYTNWASPPDSAHTCGGVRRDGKWLSELCDTPLPFVCQEDKSYETHLVLERMTWRQAQEYCRQNYTDLAVVSSQTENQALQQEINENGSLLSLVWIGLFRDGWRWSDNSDSSFRYWETKERGKQEIKVINCVTYRPSSKAWGTEDCSTTHPFYCYNGKNKAVKQVVRVNIKSDSPLNLSDVAMTDAILSQLQNKYPGVKLQWRVQPDGKILQKKKKEEN